MQCVRFCAGRKQQAQALHAAGAVERFNPVLVEARAHLPERRLLRVFRKDNAQHGNGPSSCKANDAGSGQACGRVEADARAGGVGGEGRADVQRDLPLAHGGDRAFMQHLRPGGRK